MLGDMTHCMLKGLLPALGKNTKLCKIWHYTYASRFQKEREYETQFDELQKNIARMQSEHKKG